MKKFLPILVIVGAFAGFLAIQAGFDLIQTNANQSSIVKDKTARHEQVLKELDLVTTKGKKISLKNIKAPVVILNFWASWCTPCLKEFPSLVKLRQTFTEDEVSIIAVNADEEDQENNIKKIEKKYGLNFDIVAEKNSHVSDKFLISVIPVSIVFINGQAIQQSAGAFDFMNEKLLKEIRTVLKK